MGEAQELQLNIIVHPDQANEAKSIGTGCTDIVPDDDQLVVSQGTSLRWLRIAIYALLVLFGQSIATLLGRLYFQKGGKSKWLQALVSLAGFAILFPYYCIIPFASRSKSNPIATAAKPHNSAALSTLASIYVSLGLLEALGCFLYSVGLCYLPVSTYSLISTSQLAFNAFFSFFLNSQKFTAYIVNAIVLLTVSSTLLVFPGGGDSSAQTGAASQTKYAIGFICTVGASALYGFTLSLTQLAFSKVIRKKTFRAVMDMIVYQSFVSCGAILVGLFASGEWKGLKKEMEEFESGKVSYVMILTWTGIVWQLFAIGGIGLIFEATSLFSNIVSALGLPVVPVLAVIFFHDKMNGIKIVAMVLAIWGFISYIYQHYVNHQKLKITAENKNSNSDR